MTHRLKDGWRLYYSDEGYPYYYNEVTGQSEWAQIGENYEPHEDYQKYHASEYGPSAVLADDAVEGDDNEEEEADDEQSEEGDEESGQSTDSNFDEAFGEKFKAFLRTPEGMSAVMAEQERINKYVEKKSKELAEQSDKAYARKLMLNKKNDGEVKGKDAGFLDALGLFFGVKGPSSPTKAKPINNNEEDDMSHIDVNAPKKEMFGRGAKQRHRKRSSSGSQGQDGMVEDMEGGSLSRTNSSSDADSLSSDDSDVAVINAPMFSELPEWLRPSSLYERYISPVNTYLHRHGFYASANTARQYLSTRGVEAIQNVSQHSLTFAQQAGVIIAAALFSAGSLVWTNVEPYLITFMENVIDTPLADGTARRIRTANQSTNMLTSPRDKTESARSINAKEDYSNLPEAPPFSNVDSSSVFITIQSNPDPTIPSTDTEVSATEVTCTLANVIEGALSTPASQSKSSLETTDSSCVNDSEAAV